MGEYPALSAEDIAVIAIQRLIQAGWVPPVRAEYRNLEDLLP